MTNQTLTYNNTPIKERGEMLSLTDMWRAADGTTSQRPSKWLEIDGTKQFVDYMKSTVPHRDSQLIQSLNEGGTWNTWAHWQIGMAYAKYLSPDFHAWCNQVVRDYMEGKLQPHQPHQPQPILPIEQQERELALCERAYDFSERCSDPVLRVMLLDKAKNLVASNTALPAPEAAYFQTYQVLEGLGYSEKEIRKLRSNAGKRLASAYRTLTGQEPEVVERIIDGTTREVKVYPPSFREDAEAVLAQWLEAKAA